MITKKIEGFRLSPQQKYLWLLNHKNSNNYYRTQGAFLLEGHLDKERLMNALQMVIQRLEILRTTFYKLPESTLPLQVIGDSYVPFIEQYNLQKESKEKQLEQIEAIFKNLLQRPLNLEKMPLFKIALVQCSANELTLIIGLPSLLADRFSLRHLIREISICHEQKREENIIDEPFQYVDFSEWQNELLESPETAEGREYWQQQTSSGYFELKMPLTLQKNHEFAANFQPGFITLTLEQKDFQLFESLTKKYQITYQDFFLSCFLIFLSRLTHEEEVTVGLGSSNRHHEELAQSIGLMAKYLPMSTPVDSSLNFITFCQQISQKVQELSKCQDYFVPEAEKFVGNGITFETDFHSNKITAQGEIKGTLIREFSCIQPYQLNVFCQQYSQGIDIEFHYNTKSFSSDVIEGWLRNYYTLLMNACAKPTQKIEELDLLTDDEKQRILLEFNPSLISYSLENSLNDSCIHHLFETQVKQTPQDIAVICEEEKLTYSQLNALANQLAHHLRHLGVKPDDCVGICVERSPWILIGLLGILKAGGAYVPLDPILPHERLKFMVDNSQAQIVITQQHLKSIISPLAAQTVILDGDETVISHYSEANLDIKVTSENLAYVIYTSGSTGKPKGVAIEHRQLVNYVQGIIDRLQLPKKASYGLISTFGADLGNTMIFPSLCHGGCLHIISQENMTDPLGLEDYLSQQRGIDYLKIVPSHLQALISESPNPSQILPKKTLVLGGETTPWELVQKVKKLAPNCQIVNHYGPTETTVGVLTYQVTQESQDRGTASVPLGSPLPNTQIFVLDSQLRPVPVGFPGEIYIGGDNLARGYLNQPNLTQDRFQSHPFNQQLTLKVKNSHLKLKITRGEWFNREAKFKMQTSHTTTLNLKNFKIKLSQRLYRTGDLAHYLPDGNIEFLGRIDHQIKLHGFRIELGEVEAKLKNHPSVRDTRVMVREKTDENKLLVAYVVSYATNKPKISELRNFLQKSLPEFMIPNCFVFLDRIPLTPNGKLDRQKLPLPEITRSQVETTYVSPRTPQEGTLAKIWADILHLEQVGVEDNFFELGGDSILGTQIVARAKLAGLKLKPIDLFEHQTIAALAKIIETEAFKLQIGDNQGQVPLNPIQQWFFQLSLPNLHHWNMSILLDIPPNVLVTDLETVIQGLAEHHDSLKLSFRPEKSGWIQYYGEIKEKITFIKRDLSNIPEKELSSTLATQATQVQNSLNLEHPPLFRVVWFDLGVKRGARLLVIIHHLLMDGVSWRIWLEDFHTAYNQVKRGENIQLGAKTTSFQYWSKKLKDYAQSESILSELDYWLAQFPASPSYLPRIHQQNGKVEAKIEKVIVFLDAKDTDAALHKVSKHYRTQMNELLLCGLLQTYQSWTGNNYLWVELEGHGREELFEEIDLSRTLGWFTTRFPLLLSCDPCFSPSQSLEVVKETLRQIPNRGIGYGMLRYLNQQKEIGTQLSNLPQPELCFNYLGQFTQEDSIFPLLFDDRGSEKSGLGQHTSSITLDVMVVEGQTRFEWTYNSRQYQPETIEKLAQDTINTLKTLIDDCLKSKPNYTPDDFPLAHLTQERLDKIVLKFPAIADIYPLSPLQQGLLFHCLYEAESNLYCQQKVFTLSGALNEDKFRLAWETIINRHDSLKSAFIWQNLVTPLQVIPSEVSLPWYQEDWRFLSISSQEKALEKYLKTDAQQGFSFANAPLMRLSLFRLSDNQYYLIWSHHHLLLDGWCNSIIFQEVFSVYQSLSQEKKVRLSPVSSYKNYINWLNKNNDSKAEKFWKQSLKGIKKATQWGIELPLTNKNTQINQNQAREQSQLTTEITEKLINWTQSQHLTLNTVLQGCFAFLLSRYSGEDEIIFGATVSGRPPELVGVESMVGLLINTIPVSVSIQPQLCLLDWFKQLQKEQIERLEYQYNSLVQIQKWSDITPESQLFESFITVENYPIDPSLHQGEIKIVDVKSFSQTNYSLGVTVELYPTFLLVIDYNSQQFTEKSVRRLLDQLQTLIENVPNYANQNLSEITITPTEENKILLDSFNADFD